MPDFHVEFQPESADFASEPERYMAELVKAKTDMKETLDRIQDKTDPIDILMDDQSGNVVADPEDTFERVG